MMITAIARAGVPAMIARIAAAHSRRASRWVNCRNSSSHGGTRGPRATMFGPTSASRTAASCVLRPESAVTRSACQNGFNLGRSPVVKCPSAGPRVRHPGIMTNRGVVSIGVAAGVGPEVVGWLAPAVEDAGFHALWVNDVPGADALRVLAAAARITDHLCSRPE